MDSTKKTTRVIKRKPGTVSKLYFDASHQEAIVEYNATEDQAKKDEIYLHRIFPAFKALIENLINTYKFKAPEGSDGIEGMTHDCLIFLYRVLPKYKPDKGSKAFAYFNVVAKHWLTVKSKDAAKVRQNVLSIDDQVGLSLRDLEVIEHHSVLASPEESIILDESSNNTRKILDLMKKDLRTDNEIILMNAIDELFHDDFDNGSKKVVMGCLKEMTRMESKNLSTTLSSLKKRYKEAKRVVSDE